jgi:quinol monooxygenase YgiN
VYPEKRIELFQTIGRLLETIKDAQGCRGFHFYLDVEDENSTLLVGEWETESDLNNYLHSTNFAILRGAITTLSVRSIDSKARVTSQACRI